MRIDRLAAGVVAVGLTCGVAAAQSGTVDQVSPFANASFNASATSLTWQQQIRVGIDGQLEGILIEASGDPGMSLRMRVREGATWTTQTALFDDLVTKTVMGNEQIFVDMTSANIQMAAGDLFVMEIVGLGEGVWMRGSHVPEPDPPMYPEPLYLNQSPHAGNNEWRLGFETYVLDGPGCPPDWNGDGVVDSDDLFDFLSDWAAGNADYNGDGVTDSDDLFDFLSDWAVGC